MSGSSSGELEVCGARRIRGERIQLELFMVSTSTDHGFHKYGSGVPQVWIRVSTSMDEGVSSRSEFI